MQVQWQSFHVKESLKEDLGCNCMLCLSDQIYKHTNIDSYGESSMSLRIAVHVEINPCAQEDEDFLTKKVYICMYACTATS